jgi:hypothetical protein
MHKARLLPAAGRGLTIRHARPRVLATAPAFAGMPADIRQAHAVNERSANEPRSSAKHGVGCSCCSGGGKKSSAVVRVDGSNAFPNKRPWMISH